MANTRSTEQEYIKGLKQGYALAKAQYEEIIADMQKSKHNCEIDETTK